MKFMFVYKLRAYVYMQVPAGIFIGWGGGGGGGGGVLLMFL